MAIIVTWPGAFRLNDQYRILLGTVSTVFVRPDL
jgi:hypothetical protein